MPWSKDNPPRSMKNFSHEQQEKGAKIANALVKKMEEGRAIRIATAQAKKPSKKK
jgi:uncharacterized protein YdaT